MALYRLARTPVFEKSVSRLSSEFKKLLAKQLTLLECDPKHPTKVERVYGIYAHNTFVFCKSIHLI